MASTGEIARKYFEALSRHDLDTALALWEPGAPGRIVGEREFVAPWGVQAYFGGVFDAFPDFTLEVVDLTTYRNRTAVRWRARGTFAGPGYFQGFAPNGARAEIEGCDVLTIIDGTIRSNDAYYDTGDLARRLGILPPAGSRAEARLANLANARTRLRSRINGADAERIADGVWIVRGGFPTKDMNVYLIQDDGGVTVFDAGISAMTTAVAAAGARLGGIKRVVLGHADADHRGAAPGLGAPVYCHRDEQEAAESESPFRSYWDLFKLARHARFVYSKLIPAWDGGAVKIADTVQEGDELAGFRVVELPGKAPGLIGLFRDSDRVALVSDCFYTLDIQTGIRGAPRLPHPAFDVDVEQARASIRKLAELEPSVAWAGHANPVTGDVCSELERAASAEL